LLKNAAKEFIDNKVNVHFARDVEKNKYFFLTYIYFLIIRFLEDILVILYKLQGLKMKVRFFYFSFLDDFFFRKSIHGPAM